MLLSFLVSQDPLANSLYACLLVTFAFSIYREIFLAHKIQNQQELIERQAMELHAMRRTLFYSWRQGEPCASSETNVVDLRQWRGRRKRG